MKASSLRSWALWEVLLILWVSSLRFVDPPQLPNVSNADTTPHFLPYYVRRVPKTMSWAFLGLFLVAIGPLGVPLRHFENPATPNDRTPVLRRIFGVRRIPKTLSLAFLVLK